LLALAALDAHVDQRERGSGAQELRPVGLDERVGELGEVTLDVLAEPRAAAWSTRSTEGSADRPETR
jgi:hypothetical protein